MRLSKEEIVIIKKSILNHSDNAKIMLFGSRVDKSKKGGDIDIYIETDKTLPLITKLKILTDIEIGGVLRKVDLIVKSKNSKHQPIFDTIKKEGILL